MYKMPKDFKIGMALGLVLVIISTLWLATRPSLNPQARTLNSPNITSLPETSSASNNLSPQDAYRRTIESIPPTPVFRQEDAGAENNQLSIINNRSEQPDLTVYEQAKKIKTTKFHIVRRGETLSTISVKYYGSANKWQKILEANRSRLIDANRLTPGTKLTIPE